MHVNKINYELWEKALPSIEEFSEMPPREKLMTLMWLAHLAPSSHNTQPWRFYCDERNLTISVVIDRASILPESDVNGRQAIISIGCAMENMITSGLAYGLACNIKMQTHDKEIFCYKKNTIEWKKIVKISTLHFYPIAPDVAKQSLVPCILSRKTMRAEYDPTVPVPPNVFTELSQNINSNLITLHFITDSVRKLAIAEFQGQADGYVLNSPHFSKELGGWLLPNDTESFIGMPGNTLGLDDTQAKRIHLGLQGEASLEPEDMLRFSLGGKMGFEKSPAIAFLTSKKDDVEGWIEAGRVMQRMFLVLEKNNISYAIHAAIVEVRLVNRIFAATLGTFEPLIAVFRMGYVKDTSIKKHRPHSPRMPLHSILLNELPP